MFLENLWAIAFPARDWEGRSLLGVGRGDRFSTGYIVSHKSQNGSIGKDRQINAETSSVG
jgi:hypothetical protein